jgi:hypothetical protein
MARPPRGGQTPAHGLSPNGRGAAQKKRVQAAGHDFQAAGHDYQAALPLLLFLCFTPLQCTSIPSRAVETTDADHTQCKPA